METKIIADNAFRRLVYEGEYENLKTGIESLDTKTGGLRKADLVLVSSRPEMGKTALLLNFIEEVVVNQSKASGFGGGICDYTYCRYNFNHNVHFQCSNYSRFGWIMFGCMGNL